MDWSENLRRAMDKTGRTQTRLSKEVEVSLSTVNDWCNGKRTPRLPSAIRIAEALGMSLDEVFLGKEAKPLLSLKKADLRDPNFLRRLEPLVVEILLRRLRGESQPKDQDRPRKSGRRR